MESLEHYCGVFGCITAGPWPSDLDVPQLICRALVGLQHRGQESAGIVTSYGGVDAKDLFSHRGHGLVSQIFDDHKLSQLRGNLGVGHTRYSTHGVKGASDMTGVQPFVVDTVHGLLAVAHNGELVNATSLRKEVLKRGVGLSSFSDSELITQMLSLCPPDDPDDWPSRIQNFMETSTLAYSLVIMHADKLYAVRDPFGNRPLCLGRLNRLVNSKVYAANVGSPLEGEVVGDNTVPPVGWVVSSESCPFYSIGAELIREVKPGEIVEISKDGYKSLGIVSRPEKKPPAFCIFEYVYFSRPDSMLEGQMVYSVRKNCGRMLAKESPVEADIVATIPESATPAAFGFAEATGIPYVEVLCKNRYVGRSFIQPTTRLRQLAVARKFGPYVENIVGKRIVLVDDSIVRGTTMQPMVELLKSCGAKEVHVRIASPPIKHPCYMGINIPTKTELIANRVELEKLAEHFGANSVAYLTVEGLKTAVAEKAKSESDVGYCTACLTGEYPIALEW